MLPWWFFRPYLGIFASIDADCAAFAAEMGRNSDGRLLSGVREPRAAGRGAGELNAAETEWLELELLHEELNG
jgi:hypothetical protein